MCFSAGASFTAGSMLCIVSLLSFAQVRNKSQLPLATIPLLFGLQQFAEGGIWITQNMFHSLLYQISVVGFTLICSLYATWLPLSCLLLGENIIRKRIIFLLTIMGIIISIGGICFTDYRASIIGCHVAWDYIWKGTIWHELYGFLVMGAFMISTEVRLKLLGILGALSLIITKIFFATWDTSVWCFFAAFQSILIVAVLQKVNEKDICS